MSENVQVYLCPAPSDEIRDRFPDNLYGSCDFCGDEITFRPDAPNFMKKSCYRCAAVEIIKAKAKDPNEEIKFSPWNEKECRDLLKKLGGQK